MKRRYVISAAVAILALLLYEANETDARGRTGGSGNWASAPRLATAARFAASAQRAALQASTQNTATPIQQATLSSAYASQGGMNSGSPLLAAQQANLESIHNSTAIARQLVTSNAARSALAAQLAAQNPRLSAQQAAQVAAKLLNEFANQQITAANAKSQNGVPSTGTASLNAVTPGYFQPGYYGNGASVPGAYPAASSVDDGDGGYAGVAQTAPGAALQGEADVVGAEGRYNQASSAAALNMTRAESNEMRNQVQSAETYWEMRKLGRAEQARELGPHPEPEELARRAHAAAPRALTSNDIDRVSGSLYWPAALQDDEFQTNRLAIEEYTGKWVRYGELEYADQTQLREQIGAMYDTLKSHINEIPPQEYAVCRSFLDSLLYATTHAVI